MPSIRRVAARADGVPRCVSQTVLYPTDYTPGRQFAEKPQLVVGLRLEANTNLDAIAGGIARSVYLEGQIDAQVDVQTNEGSRL